MGLIPIPQEETKTDAKTSVSKHKKSLIARIRKKLALKEVSRDEKIVGNTCIKMIRYVTENQDELTLDEISTLLRDMERSIISIQKKKKNLVERKNKK